MKPEDKFVEVRIHTTSGDIPKAPAFERLPANQPIKVFLEKVSRELHLTNTDGWVLRLGSKTLKTDTTWAENGLAGEQAALDWGPDAGGGGNA